MCILYSDSEVNVFHPVCEEALNSALARLGKDHEYRILHHQHTGTLEMDFAVQNIATGKYLSVVEVKRTPADVHSARYQFQAMSYLQMNADETEKPFYILTNLEYAFSFRYDPSRPRVFQQMLAPGLHTIGRFADLDKDALTERLTTYFEAQLRDFLQNRYEYLVTLEQFAAHMERIKTQPKLWKSSLVVLLYEYIRGAFSFVTRNELRDVRLFRNDVLQICNEAARVNFKEIFACPQDKYERTVIINSDELSNLFDFGSKNVSGDSISNILHQIVSEGHEHEGEVPTDLELGRFVAELAHNISGDLQQEECVCDPAAGSGNLISSAIDTYSLTPNQIKANDVNEQLLELLSLRLGLNFVRTVDSAHSPHISSKNITELSRNYFSDVKVVVMNPPFLAGINAVARKQPLYRRINELAGHNTETNIGQMPLEAAFLELLTYLVDPGTTIACVFPKTHLLARGPEAQMIRRLIINNLGLRTVFTYPGKEIFDDVTKDTCVLVGKAMDRSDYVNVISSYANIPDLDLHRFAQMLGNTFGESFRTEMPGIVARKIQTQELIASVADGWRGMNSEMVDAIAFVDNTFKLSNKCCQMVDCEYNMKRGGAGNSGGSDLIFADSRQEFLSAVLADGILLKPGMRNAELDTFVGDRGDSSFLDISDLTDTEIESLIRTYMSLPERTGRQTRARKTLAQWKAVLTRESRGKFTPYSVLIPRALRRKGRVHLVRNDIFVSTNFLVCYDLSEDEAIVLSTWFSTVFYQLICEVSSKDQEGMRKMEVNDIMQTYIPKVDLVSDRTLQLLKDNYSDIEFVDLQTPEIRDIDRIWANELFGDNANEMLIKATRLLSYLGNKRNG